MCVWGKPGTAAEPHSATAVKVSAGFFFLGGGIKVQNQSETDAFCTQSRSSITRYSNSLLCFSSYSLRITQFFVSTIPDYPNMLGFPPPLKYHRGSL